MSKEKEEASTAPYKLLLEALTSTLANMMDERFETERLERANTSTSQESQNRNHRNNSDHEATLSYYSQSSSRSGQRREKDAVEKKETLRETI